VLDLHRRFMTLDFIGRVEKFTLGMSYVLAAAGVTKPIDLDVRYNEGPPAPYPLREIMNEEIYSLLMNIYARDVDQLRYQDEVEKLRPA
jgi:hypothetical protein